MYKRTLTVALVQMAAGGWNPEANTGRMGARNRGAETAWPQPVAPCAIKAGRQSPGFCRHRRPEMYRTLQTSDGQAVVARISNATHYANANLQAQPLLAPALLKDPGVYPPASARRNMFTLSTQSTAGSRLENRLWTTFKTGK